MQYLNDFDIVRTVFFYRGSAIQASGATALNPVTNAVYGQTVPSPNCRPEIGYYEFSIPNDLVRMYERGRALCSVTNLWTGVWSDSVVDWDHEQIALYSNIMQPYGYDARTAASPFKIWSGTAINHSGNLFYLNSSSTSDQSSFLTSHTFQTIAPLPSSISFQFASVETAMNQAITSTPFHTVQMFNSVGGTPYPVSVCIELTFVVPRVAATSSVKAIL